MFDSHIRSKIIWINSASPKKGGPTSFLLNFYGAPTPYQTKHPRGTWWANLTIRLWYCCAATPQKRTNGWKLKKSTTPLIQISEKSSVHQKPRWWQLKYFLFSPLPGEKIPILTHIFQVGWNHQSETFRTFGLQPLAIPPWKQSHVLPGPRRMGWVRFNSFPCQKKWKVPGTRGDRSKTIHSFGEKRGDFVSGFLFVSFHGIFRGFVWRGLWAKNSMLMATPWPVISMP